MAVLFNFINSPVLGVVHIVRKYISKLLKSISIEIKKNISVIRKYPARYGIIFPKKRMNMDRKLYRNRLADKRLDFYLSTFGAVCVEGPKWCGKTWTSSMHAQSAFFVGSPKDNFANRQLARLDVNQALSGETPHLIDEWQEVPEVWDAARRFVDESGNKRGILLFTGSTALKKD